MKPQTKLLLGLVAVLLLAVLIFQVPYGKSVDSVIADHLNIEVGQMPRLADGSVDLVRIYNDRNRADLEPEENLLFDIARVTHLRYSGNYNNNGQIDPPELNMLVGDPELLLDPLMSFDNYFEQHDSYLEAAQSLEKREAYELVWDTEARAFRAWKSTEFPEANNYLQLHQEHLEIVLKAACKNVRFPLWAFVESEGHLSMTILPGAHECSKIAKLLAISMMNHLGESRLENFFKEQRVLRSIATELFSQPLVTPSLFGIYCQLRSTTCDQQLLQSGLLRIDDCARYRSELQQAATSGMLNRNLEIQHAVLLDKVQILARSKVIRRQPFQKDLKRNFLPVNWQTTTDRISEHLTELQKVIEIADARNRMAAAISLKESVAAQAKLTKEYYWQRMLVGAVSRGHLYADLIIEDTFRSTGLIGAEIRETIRRDGIIAALAIEQFRLTEGRLPKTLHELVPDYLESVPVDRYNSQPLTYRLADNGYFLYSIGYDGEDNLDELLARGQAPDRKSLERWENETSDIGFYFDLSNISDR